MESSKRKLDWSNDEFFGEKLDEMDVRLQYEWDYDRNKMVRSSMKRPN